MGRAPRINASGATYHVTARGIRKSAVYLDGIDYARFRSSLAEIAAELEWSCHTYVLMPNHFHLVVETRHANLSTGMQRLNWRHAVRFNWRHGFEGHLFERRFFSGLIESEAHFLETCRYVALNPVRAGLCDHPHEWPFGSYRALVGTRTDPVLTPSRLLAAFGDDGETARRRYSRFVHAGVASGRVLVPGTRTRPNQPKPYVPAKRVANRRTSRLAGSPTTLR